MVGLTGCAGDPYNQSTGRSMDVKRTAQPDYRQSADQGIEDSRTAERVREALAVAPEYEFVGVHLAAGNGALRLSSLVNTSAQRNRAGEVASKVVGVKDVVNNIKVKE
jgi:osmotically-inducible protein OsmY